MATEHNKRVVANFVEVCQNQHDLAAADDIFHPEFANGSPVEALVPQRLAPHAPLRGARLLTQ